jgi:hypothetical protein
MEKTTAVVVSASYGSPVPLTFKQRSNPMFVSTIACVPPSGRTVEHLQYCLHLLGYSVPLETELKDKYIKNHNGHTPDDRTELYTLNPLLPFGWDEYIGFKVIILNPGAYVMYEHDGLEYVLSANENADSVSSIVMGFTV